MPTHGTPSPKLLHLTLLSVVLTLSVLEWHKKWGDCILSEVMRQVSPEERNVGVSSLVVQRDVSELVWPLGAEG